jgi:thiol-disulfide isomerase/thioredoxin
MDHSMNRKAWTTSVAALGTVIILALAGCGGGSGSVGSSSAAGGGVKTVVPASDRRDVISLSGTTLEGKSLDLAVLRGKPVVLNIWGSWCPPCRKEAPDVQAAAAELGSKAAFVGIDILDGAAQARAYQREFKITYPSLIDEGNMLLALHGAVPLQSPPVTLVLDQQGRIAGRFLGPVTTRTLVDMVADVTTSS